MFSDLNLKDWRYINLLTLFYSESSSEYLKKSTYQQRGFAKILIIIITVVLNVANMVSLFTGENIMYSVYTIPEYISTWQSFTVNSLEHISSTTCCLPPCRCALCLPAFLHGECQQLACVNSMKYFHGNMFSCLNSNQTWATLFQPGMCFGCDGGAVFLALICGCSHEHHQIFTVPSLMSQLSLPLASFISFDTEK